MLMSAADDDCPRRRYAAIITPPPHCRRRFHDTRATLRRRYFTVTMFMLAAVYAAAGLAAQILLRVTASREMPMFMSPGYVDVITISLLLILHMLRHAAIRHASYKVAALLLLMRCHEYAARERAYVYVRCC